MYSNGGDTILSRHFSWGCINNSSQGSCMYLAILDIVAMAVSNMTIECLKIFSFARVVLASLGSNCCCLGHWTVFPLLSICLQIHFSNKISYPLTEPQIIHHWVSLMPAVMLSYTLETFGQGQPCIREACTLHLSILSCFGYWCYFAHSNAITRRQTN